MNEWMIFGGIALCAVFLAGMQGRREQNRQRARAQKLIREEYGTAPKENKSREEAAVEGSFLHAEKDFYLDDITWNDLDMDLIFKRLNYARCSAGAGELYRMLRCPAMEAGTLKERDALARSMAERKSLREQLSLALYEIGFTGKYALEEYLDYLDNLGEGNNARHILLDCLYIPAILLLFIRPAAGALLLFGALVVNIATYFGQKAQVNPYLVSFAYVLRMLRGAEKIEGLLGEACANGSMRAQNVPRADDVFLKYRGILEKDIGELESFRRFSGVAMSMSNPVGGSGPVDILFDYLKMALHLDLIKFNQMLKIVRRKDAVIRELAGAVGTLDACICIAYYRASSESWCEPALGERPGVEAVEICHPLLAAPVKNSIRTERGVLITGSNASGKSTFLKTVALGTVFAQTIYTVPAKSFSAPFCRMMSSMSLRDNLSGGESYFMAEIRALKRITDACAKGETRVVCFVDEVLRGTNTVERIAASSRILQSLSGKNVLCFAATHDIELTHLLEDVYENYHFEETIEKGDISFNYLLKEGRAQSRNAIRLLEAMGYDECVIKEAEAMAEHFLECGEWKKL